MNTLTKDNFLAAVEAFVEGQDEDKDEHYASDAVLAKSYLTAFYDEYFECAVYASVSPSLAPVYAHPAPPVDQAQAAAPVPMTDVEIYVVARNHPRIATLVPHIEVGQFARAIEKHHKIGAKPLETRNTWTGIKEHLGVKDDF
jgi:hypothetical protein